MVDSIQLVDRQVVIDHPCNGPHKCKEGLWYGHHKGKSIWKDGKVFLSLEDTPCVDHVASPHYIDGLLFYHGREPATRRQMTFVWDGERHYGPVAPFYLRPWKIRHLWYGLCKYHGCSLFSAWDPTKEWTFLRVVIPKVRHGFYYRGWVYYTLIGDAPERVFRARLKKPNNTAQEVLRPVYPWEGAEMPLKPSKSGAVTHLVNQLRDPMVYQGTLYYVYGGEQGIARVEL